MLLSIVFIDLQWCRMDIITSETQANHSQHHLVKDGAHAEKIRSFLSTLGASWGGWMLSLVLAAPTQERDSAPCYSLFDVGVPILSSDDKQFQFIPTF